MGSDQPAVTIIRAKNNQGALLGDILGEAFAPDPAFNWVIPDRRIYPAFFRMLAEKWYLRHSRVYLDFEHRGAAMWLPPGIPHKVPMCATQLVLVARLVRHSGPGILKRLLEVQKTLERHHPKEPHYYLHAIGIRRAYQGRGIGSALIREVTHICDTEQTPAYLENSSPNNMPLYKRHGFEVQAEGPMGRGGPPLYFMWREPRPISSPEPAGGVQEAPDRVRQR
jgi:ribosomal protein S18 acetylase RimI-like enzyme